MSGSHCRRQAELLWLRQQALSATCTETSARRIPRETQQECQRIEHSRTEEDAFYVAMIAIQTYAYSTVSDHQLTQSILTPCRSHLSEQQNGPAVESDPRRRTRTRVMGGGSLLA